MISDDEEIYVLSNDKFAESLVLVERQQPKTMQEQAKQFQELKNSFSALLTAYQDLRQKLSVARKELNVLKGQKMRSSVSMEQSASCPPLPGGTDSSELAKVILLYNDKIVDILNQVESHVPPSFATKNAVSQDAAAQVSFTTVEAQTQYDAPVQLQLEGGVQTGLSLLPPVNESSQQVDTQRNDNVTADVRADQSCASMTSSFIITDDSEDEASNNAPEEKQVRADTLRPPPTSEARLDDSPIVRLLIDNPRPDPSNTSEFNYCCPVCGQKFEMDALETQAVSHLMQCTAQQKEKQHRDCPICNKSFEISASFSQRDFEDHVQCCCEAGDMGAVAI